MEPVGSAAAGMSPIIYLVDTIPGRTICAGFTDIVTSIKLESDSTDLVNFTFEIFVIQKKGLKGEKNMKKL